MAAVVLHSPRIVGKNPQQDIRFIDIGGKLISEECTLSVEVVFTHGQQMDCSLRVGISPHLRRYFMIEPNTVDSNEYEIFRYYGVVNSGKTDTFKFRLVSYESLAAIRANASPAFLVVRVTDCSNNATMEESVSWRII